MSYETRVNKSTGNIFVRATIGYKNNRPIRVSRTFPRRTRKNVIELWVCEMKELGSQQAMSQRRSFDALIDEWLAYKKTHLQKRTFHSYTVTCNKHLKGKFDSVESVTTADVRKLIDSLLHYAPETIIRIRNLLRAIFEYAVNHEYIEQSPINKSVTLPKKKRKFRIKVFTVEQFEVFSEALRTGCEVDLALRTLLLTGLRVSELLALQPWHITETTLRVEQSLEFRYKTRVTCAPKSDHAYRTIAIPEHLSAPLLALPKREFLLDTSYKVLRVAIKRRCFECGVPVLNLKALRHSHSTYLLAKGVNVLAVSKRLGHHSPAFTLSVYGHLVPSMNDKVLEVLG